MRADFLHDAQDVANRAAFERRARDYSMVRKARGSMAETRIDRFSNGSSPAGHFRE